MRNLLWAQRDISDNGRCLIARRGYGIVMTPLQRVIPLAALLGLLAAPAQAHAFPTAPPAPPPNCTPLLPTTTEYVQLHSLNNSGVTANVGVCDDGTLLVTTGRAVGMSKGRLYVSLWYGNGSTAAGPAAGQCQSDRTLTLAQMLVGTWAPLGNGVRGLVAAPQVGGTPNGVRLSQIGTISIRQVTPSQLAKLQKGQAIAPQVLQLKACAAV